MGVCAGRQINGCAPGKDTTGKDNYSNYTSPGKQWFMCEADAIMQPRVAKIGLASAEATPPSTLAQMLTLCGKNHGDKVALMVERPCPPAPPAGEKPEPALPEEEWTKWTYNEMLADVKKVAKGFISLGFSRYDSVNVWGFNSPEWVMSAHAAGWAGGKVAGLYPTDTPDTAAYKVVHSGGSVVVVDDRAKIDKLVKGLKDRGDCTRIKAVVVWGTQMPEGDENVEIPGCGSVRMIGWNKLLTLGADSANDGEMDTRVEQTDPGNCAALIYTSGTTGEPKAVMISHDNIVFEAAAVMDLLKKSCDIGLGEQERILSYLPLSHVAGMMVDIVCPLVLTSNTDSWLTTHFARPYDLKAGSIKDRLCFVRPTMFLGVPLVWEKIADKMRAIGAEVTGLKKSIATWAKGLGLQHSRDCQMGGDGAYPFGYSLADTIVLKNVKAGLGLDACKFGFTGAAPIRVDTLEYFGSLGLMINEVYGMSECTGACTFSLDEAHMWGSCGFELPGVEVRVFNVDATDSTKKTLVEPAPSLDCTDEKYMGEICFRGRNIMMGYLANPDLGDAHVAEIQKKTADAIDREGWLHSGDKGLMTQQGMLKITGRFKELIIGDGGENIAPVPIEDHVKKMCDGVNEVMMIGDKRKYNVAFVTLKAVGANGETPGTDALDAGAKRINPDVQTISGAMDDKVWIDAITAAITSANNNTKVCHNPTFKIQKFMILPFNFSEEGNELTPTKKLKRSVVEKNYGKLVEQMYKTDGVYIRYAA